MSPKPTPESAKRMLHGADESIFSKHVSVWKSQNVTETGSLAMWLEGTHSEIQLEGSRGNTRWRHTCKRRLRMKAVLLKKFNTKRSTIALDRICGRRLDHTTPKASA